MALSIHKIGNVPGKVQKALSLIKNKDIHPVDIVADCGLSTIYAGSSGGQKQYNDEDYVDISPLYESDTEASSPVLDNYKAVVNEFVSFVKNEKSSILIYDTLRHVLVSGKNKMTLSDKTKTFSEHIYRPLKHLNTTFNSSYAATYNNWAKVYDEGLESETWIPISGIISSIYTQSDAAYNTWSAPAGFDRGRITNIQGVALHTNQEQRDLLYNISINSIASYPNDGYIILGQKTSLTKPSVFDRINVRRMFLYLEKKVKQTVRQFIFENNTFKTRSDIVSILSPLFESAKTDIIQGIYDYKIVCDATNNTDSVIDDNAIVVDIFIKPSRTSEFILVNFYSTQTSQDFIELIT